MLFSQLKLGDKFIIDNGAIERDRVNPEMEDSLGHTVYKKIADFGTKELFKGERNAISCVGKKKVGLYYQTRVMKLRLPRS